MGAPSPTSFPTPEMLKKPSLFSEAREFQTRPSRIVLEFKLAEEQESYEVAIRAMDLRLILVGLVLWPSAIRHGNLPAIPPCLEIEQVLRALEQKMEIPGLKD